MLDVQLVCTPVCPIPAALILAGSTSHHAQSCRSSIMIMWVPSPRKLSWPRSASCDYPPTQWDQVYINPWVKQCSSKHSHGLMASIHSIQIELFQSAFDVPLQPLPMGRNPFGSCNGQEQLAVNVQAGCTTPCGLTPSIRNVVPCQCQMHKVGNRDNHAVQHHLSA